jgi:hypothetical protein
MKILACVLNDGYGWATLPVVQGTKPHLPVRGERLSCEMLAFNKIVHEIYLPS